jgi:hypothetical protein
MVTKRSALGVFLVAVVMLFCRTFASQPWEIAATVAAALCGTAALLLLARARSGMPHRI